MVGPISSASDSPSRLWDLKAGLLLQTMVGHSEKVVAVALTANGEKALSASSDGTIKVWSTDVHSRYDVMASLQHCHCFYVLGVSKFKLYFCIL